MYFTKVLILIGLLFQLIQTRRYISVKHVFDYGKYDLCLSYNDNKKWRRRRQTADPTTDIGILPLFIFALPIDAKCRYVTACLLNTFH